MQGEVEINGAALGLDEADVANDDAKERADHTHEQRGHKDLAPTGILVLDLEHAAGDLFAVFFVVSHFFRPFFFSASRKNHRAGADHGAIARKNAEI